MEEKKNLFKSISSLKALGLYSGEQYKLFNKGILEKEIINRLNKGTSETKKKKSIELLYSSKR